MMLRRKLFTALFALGACVTFSAHATEKTQVPQNSDPEACQASRQNREECKRWYSLNETPEPDACKSARANREECARWYAVGEQICIGIKIDQVVHFDFNKSTIKPESYGILDDVAQIIKKTPTAKRIRVEGHTDAIGSDSYNMKLSDRRAAAVRDYLIGKGIDAARLDSAGYGESKPLATNATAEGRSKNRRTEFTVVDDGCVKN